MVRLDVNIYNGGDNLLRLVRPNVNIYNGGDICLLWWG